MTIVLKAVKLLVKLSLQPLEIAIKNFNGIFIYEVLII